MMRPLPKKRSARRRSTKATVVEALARRDAHRRSVRGVTAASLRSNAAAASPLNRSARLVVMADSRHGAAAARPPRRRAPGARTNSCQQKIRGLFTYRRAGFNPFFLRQEIARKTGFSTRVTYLAGPICTSNLSAHGASGAEIERQNLFC